MFVRSSGDRGASSALIVRVAGRLCALPVAAVIETMRPLPVRPIADAPASVLGVAIIRGVPTVVVDAARLLGGDAGDAGAGARFVTLRVGARSVALAVDSVVAVRELPAALAAELPSLVVDTAAIAAIGVLDAELLVVLRATHLVPDHVLAAQDVAP